MAHYWEAQEKRWYEQYLESEKMVSELETALINVEAVALKHIANEEARKAIKALVDAVWRGARP
jgi:hypothetical protein